MMQVAGAHDDRVDLLARTILEVTGVFVNFSQNRDFFKLFPASDNPWEQCDGCR